LKKKTTTTIQLGPFVSLEIDGIEKNIPEQLPRGVP
jgi:hypothetical protein